VVGVDLGGTKVLAGVVDESGRVLSRCKQKTRSLKDQPDALLDLIAEAVREAIAEASLGLHDVAAVGLGVPGSLDLDRARVAIAPNLGWFDLPVRDDLAKRLDGVEVRLENDVRCAALAEHVLGVGAGLQSLAAIFVGTGIGGGLVVDGRLAHGSHGGAGEIGHMPIRPGRAVCSCGQRGHLEALAARPALVRYIVQRVKKGERTVLEQAHKGDLTQLTSGDIEAAVRQGDRLATRAARRSARYVGLAMGGLVNLVDPELIVLGGGVVEALGQRYVDWASQAARPHILSAATRSIPIVSAQLGDDAGLLGAALAARQE
jgi:glucokinase